MKKIYLLLALNVCAKLIIAQTPITLGNTNMPGSGDTLRYTNFQLASAGNYTQTGMNFNWDFSDVSSTTEGVRDFKAASGTPYYLFFLSQGEYGEKIADTLVGGTGTLSITKYYDFYKKQTTPANAFVADGAGMTISGIPVPSYYSDKDELYNFPMTFPKYDSTTFKFSTLSTTLIPIKYTKAGYRVTVVDGWGTVVTPYGTENCLRLITTQYSKDTTVITLPIATIPPIKIGVDNFQRSYQWMSLNSKIPFVEITGNLVGTNYTPTTLRYRGFKKGDISTVGLKEEENNPKINVYPNPVKDQLYLQTKGIVDGGYEIYSLDGKQISTLKTVYFENKAALNVSSLEAGVYLLKTSIGRNENYLKFVKE